MSFLLAVAMDENALSLIILKLRRFSFELLGSSYLRWRVGILCASHFREFFSEKSTFRHGQLIHPHSASQVGLFNYM